MKGIKVSQNAENQWGINFMCLSTTACSYVPLGQATSDGIEWKWENSGWPILRLNNGRVIGIIIKTH